MRLFETFRDPKLRVNKAIVFIDIVDSTGMKEREAEAAWLTTCGYIYDVITDVVESGGAGEIVKYLGDGAMVAYGEDHAIIAINDAINVQQTIKNDVDRKSVNVHCSIGIAMGEVVDFETSRSERDYLGLVVDRAARLCSIASAGAVFVDTPTTASAQMNRVRSTIGVALGRKTDEYQGPVERANVPGFVSPVEYHEIKWDQQLFGVKSKVVTAAAESRPALSSVSSNDTSKPAATLGRRGVRGTVNLWNKETGRGFVTSADGEEFYCDSRYIVGGDELQRDDIVYFCPQEGGGTGKRRVAGAAVYLNQEVDAIVTNVREEGYGFLQVRDQRGNPQDLFFSLNDAEDGLCRDEVVICVVGETGRGARAEEVARRPAETLVA
jgi:class 3 adenylate cyclase/cold shock CspA family protein